ncbi:hypothetical protein MalM25_36860 [Planctomycetes bacterium MalM25]|nr:hypothetical protein MalM25_36860 [Planctomycetes bacterium MalM25]
MDPAAQKRRRQGRRLFWALVAAVVLLPLSLALYVTFGPNPPIHISKQTTYITAPLTEEGLPDYAAALLADMRKGVTPENNGAIPFLQAMWPANEENLGYSSSNAEVLCKELGMPVPAGAAFSEHLWSDRMNDEERLLFKRRMKSVSPAGPSTESYADEIGLIALQRSWTSHDIPFLSNWLRTHREGFDLLCNAAEKKMWYLPDPTMLRGGSETPEGGAGLRGLIELRNACINLRLAAMHDAGEGRLARAIRRALAIFRLSRLFRRESLPSDVHSVCAFEGSAYAAIRQLCSSGGLPLPELERLLAGLDGLPLSANPPPFDRDRLIFLDWAVEASRQGSWFEDDHRLIEALSSRTAVDWNLVLGSINELYDAAEVALALPTRPQRMSAIGLIEKETQARLLAINHLASSPTRFLTPQSRARVLSDRLLSIHGPLGCRHLLELHERSHIDYQLTRLAIALAILRAEHGDYPDVLTTLVPDVIPALPNDPFGAPFIYRKLDNGYLLYSTGPNQTDDGGSNAGGESDGYGTQTFEGVEIDAYFDESSDTLTPEEQAAYDLIELIPEGADDHAIRMPLPIEPWPWEKQPAKSE